MKKHYASFLIAFLLISQITSAQQVQWLTSTPINYNLNPELPQQPTFATAGKIYAARMVDFVLNFGIQNFGSMAVECYDTNGSLTWSFPIGPKLFVEAITADASGNSFISGVYMETLNLGGSDSLVNTGTGFNTNLFLFSLDANGNLRWKKNMTPGNQDAFSIPALTIDPQNNCWYGCVFFDSTAIRKLDANGNDLQSHHIEGSRTLGNFSFDPNGNMFLAGSSGFQTMNINGFTTNVPEPYMMYVARINAAGNTSWIQMVHDVTFQFPLVAATDNGDAYVSGNLADSTSFGNVVLQGTQWVYDIFLTKIDSAGNFMWGVEVPFQPVITGDFQRGKNNFLDVDGLGNVYISGSLRGTVDWGNGVITNSGTIQTYGNSIISFDNNGAARWQVTGSATGFVAPYSLSVTDPDECYFSGSAVGTTTFDSLTTNAGGNYSFFLGKINAGSSTGIGEGISNEMLYVYPNPVKNQFTMHNLQCTIGNTVEISIYNMLGDRVVQFQKSINNSKVKIDVSGIPTGMYTLQAGNTRTKFIIQHE